MKAFRIGPFALLALGIGLGYLAANIAFSYSCSARS